MEKLSLIGRNGGENKVVEFKEVTFAKGTDIDGTLKEVTDNKVFYAKKEAIVFARQAVLGEKVVTRPGCYHDGKEYSFNETEIVVTEKDIANGCMLVTNPDGEVYMVKKEKFDKQYKDIGEGFYQSVGPEKPFVTTTEDICFKASWGEMQFAPSGSRLCVEGKEDGGIYSVTNLAFDMTYRITASASESGTSDEDRATKDIDFPSDPEDEEENER